MLHQYHKKKNLQKSELIRIIFINAAIFVALFIAVEIIFRSLLQSDLSFMKPFRHIDFYADYYSDDDYWKLQYIFEKAAPGHPDLLLGWVKPEVTLGTYDHAMAKYIGSKTPVLLYGDSFAHCVTSQLDCFNGILNNNQEFSRKYYLINYGIYGYGLDQIYLLFKQTVDKYREPIVIISLLDSDLDRSILTVRDGQKPYFVVSGEDLNLRGVPIDMDPKHYHSMHPPEILSYIGRSWKRVLIDKIVSNIWEESEITMKKKKLNKLILMKIYEELRARKIKYFFLVFEKPADIFHPPGWRVRFLLEFFNQNQIPYLFARDIILRHANDNAFGPDKYQYCEKNYHPNVLYNQLISDFILQRIKI